MKTILTILGILMVLFSPIWGWWVSIHMNDMTGLAAGTSAAIVGAIIALTQDNGNGSGSCGQ